jgi:signal transduction histidine kinase
MASLGGLVAGVAHEINTPIGISITAASHLDEGIRNLDRSFKEGKLTKSDFSQFMEMLGESNTIIQTNLYRAAELVKSFKLVAVDQSNEQSRLFDLREYLHNVYMSLGPKLKKTQHKLILNVPENMALYCDPGIFSQIMTNLVMNSLIHGFKGIGQGDMHLDVTEQGNDIELVYRDNGRGLDPQIADRIFEPFVTTTRGQGGSGLGTHIVYNLVTQALKGKISCESQVGKGVVFKIIFPRKSVSLPQVSDI